MKTKSTIRILFLLAVTALPTPVEREPFPTRGT
jgi:hypothetical protein